MPQGGHPPHHSITSSARAKNVSGIVRPSALAVLRLTTGSNLVGCSTGISAGFTPRRILSINPAVRRKKSGKLAAYDVDARPRLEMDAIGRATVPRAGLHILSNRIRYSQYERFSRRGAADRSGLRYPGDLTGAEWAVLEPWVPPAKYQTLP